MKTVRHVPGARELADLCAWQLFGLYGLSGAADLGRLALLRAGLRQCLGRRRFRDGRRVRA